MITTEVPAKDRTHTDICKAALEGGGRLIQYREKNKTFAEMVKEATEIKKLCDEFDALFIVNDWIKLAKEVDADGLHLGQGDESIEEARKILTGKIIGLSATCLDGAIEAQAKGADYIGAGPVFETPSKNDAAEPFGLKTLAEIRKRVSVPIVAIGGITKENMASVLEAGADAVAVISAIAAADDMEKAIRDLINEFVAKR